MNVKWLRSIFVLFLISNCTAVGYAAVRKKLSEKKRHTRSMSDVVYKNPKGRRDAVSLREHVDAPEGIMPLGREYYHALLDKSMDRHWAFPISFSYVHAHRGYDCCGKNKPLSNAMFGDSVKLKDIYLFSRLSNNDLVFKTPDGNRGHDRENPPTPGDATAPYGDFSSDQYPNLLADMELRMKTNFHEFGTHFSGIYRFNITDACDITGAIGLTVPIKSRKHELELQLVNGTLFTPIVPADNTLRQNPMDDFYNEFSDVFDFLVRAVLEPKGIELCPLQHEVGFGDVSLFTLVDFGARVDWAYGMQTGIEVVFPSGKKAGASRLFDIGLGNNGSYLCNVFFNANFASDHRYFNPAVRIVGGIGVGSSGARELRIPELKVNAQTSFVNVLEAADVLNVNITVFSPQPVQTPNNSYRVSAFSELDSIIPGFADNATCAHIRSGPRLLLGVSNYMFDVIKEDMRLGIFYDYMRKGDDKITVSCDPGKQLDTSKVQQCLKSSSHTLGVNLTYKFKDMCEVNFGSQHVFKGRNVPQVHEFFFSVIAVF